MGNERAHWRRKLRTEFVAFCMATGLIRVYQGTTSGVAMFVLCVRAIICVSRSHERRQRRAATGATPMSIYTAQLCMFVHAHVCKLAT